jgi:tetratricopeptide (TPR) repeat protein
MGRTSSGPHQGATEIEAELQWASAAIDRGHFPDAERLARNVLGRVPQHPTALHLLGCALLLQGHARQAVAPLERAVRANQDPTIETQLAIALRRSGRTDDALARLRRATKRRPAYPVAFHELGFLLFSLNQIDEAIAVIGQGLELAPRMPELSVLLGGIHHARRDRGKAKAAYGQALAVAPEHAGAHYGMGVVLFDDGEFLLAAEHLERSLASNPGDAQGQLKLGACLLELGRPDDALARLRTVTRSEPQLYGVALKVISSSSRGRFWLRPSSAAKCLA